MCSRCHASLVTSGSGSQVASGGQVTADVARRRRRIALAVLAVLWLLCLLWWLLRGFVPGVGSGKGNLTGILAGGLGNGQSQAQGVPAAVPGQAEPANAVASAPSDPASSGGAGGLAASNAPPSNLIDLGDDPLKTRLSQNAGQAAAGATGVAGMFAGGRGSKFVYVLDKSSSMSGPGKFDAVLNELRRQLTTLQPRHQFYIILFDDWAHPMPAVGLQPASPQNLRTALVWLATQYPGRGTDPTDAILQALDLDPHTIWILSDGEFSGDVVAQVNAANRVKQVCINTIAIHDPALNTLKPLADDNGGTYRYVRNPNSPATGWPRYGYPGTLPGSGSLNRRGGTPPN